MSAAPKRYWFKAKNYGWGWTPCTAEGWGVVTGGIAAFTLFLVLAILFADSLAVALLFGFLAALSIGVMVWISWKTGEKPRWRWGGS
jgi:uncharacterized integral membrane protein